MVTHVRVFSQAFHTFVHVDVSLPGEKWILYQISEFISADPNVVSSGGTVIPPLSGKLLISGHFFKNEEGNVKVLSALPGRFHLLPNVYFVFMEIV